MASEKVADKYGFVPSDGVGLRNVCCRNPAGTVMFNNLSFFVKVRACFRCEA